ncbi:hypothetical protein A4A49_09147 [Nicotiana attenuata]|uniref:Uncharacterized protein n=1 Tax=Nicotiana attenuata TaxID=49451 RepID=A0A1J6IQJ3_NICAT|nr:hypothetical protein A4A49_09147 [Nicotiana attenuata]
MGLHLLIIGKINLMATSSHSLSSPLLVSLLWPFILKLAAFSCRPIGQVYSDLVYSLRLFSFQMSQITFNTTTDQSTGGSGGNSGGSGGGGGNTRWERAVRLICERITLARHSQFSETDEESFRDFSMIAL